MKSRKRMSVLVIVLVAISMAAAAYGATADYVIQNGKIYTSNAKQPWAQAVAIDAKNIVYVGDKAGAKAFIGKETIVADLKGKVVLPGIISAHEHPIVFMGLAAGLVLDFTGNKDAMLKSLSEYIKANPNGPFFSFGGGWEAPDFIYRQDIDNVISDKPFVMIAQSGHGGWANTKALEMAGIKKGKPDPIDYFERDKDGTPNGYLGSGAAVFYMISKLGLIEKNAVLEQADDILGYLSSLGITTVHDAGVPPGTEEVLFSAIGELEKQHRLSVRIMGSAAMAQRPQHIEASIASLKKYSPMYSSELFNLNTLKIHGDGDFGGFTAGLLEPYTDNPDTRGLLSFPDPDQLSTFMLDAVKLGLDIHAHCIGDWTCRVILDGFEEVRKAGYKDARLSTGHTQLVDKQDRPRFKELDITANTFATGIAVPSEEGPIRLGEERWSTYMPMKSFINNGVRLTLSADWPVEDINPFLQMYTAMTRSRLGEDEFLLPASEKLTLEDAIRAFTADAAYQVRMEKIIGSIEIGKRADLIVIDRDIFNIEKDKIPETNVLITMMNGKVVHEEAVDWGKKFPVEAIEDFDFCDSQLHDH
jgi:predicted amidohydrolase YtcJ